MSNGQTQPSIVRKPRQRRWLGIAIAVALIAATATVFLALRLARPLTEGALSNALGTPVAIGDLSLDLRHWTAVATNVVIGKGDDRLSAQRATIAIDLRALLGRRIVLDDVALAGLAGTVTIDATRRVTVSGIPTSSPTQTDTPGSTIVIRHLTAADTTATVHHVLQGSPRTVALRINQFTAKDLTVRTDGDELRLDADVQGAADDVPLSARIEIAPEGSTEAIDIRIETTGLTLPTPLVDLPPAFGRLTGNISGGLTFHHDASKQESWLEAELRGDALQLPGRADTALAAKAIHLQRLRIDLQASTIDLGPVAVDEPSVMLAMVPDGIASPVETGDNTTAGSAQWQLIGGTVDVSGGSIALRRDQHRYQVDISKGRWDDIASGRATKIELSGKPTGGGTVAVSGTLALDPLDVALAVTTNEVALPALAEIIPSVGQLRGKASGVLTYHRNLPQRKNQLGGKLRVDSPQLPGRADTLLAARTIDVQQLGVDFQQSTIDLGSVVVTQPSVVIAIAPDGVVLPVEAGDAGNETPTPWRLTGGAIDISGGTLTLRRERRRYEVAVDTGRWDGIVSGHPGTIKLSGQAAGGGTIAVSGHLTVEPLNMALAVTTESMTLTNLTDMLPPLPLSITKGTASGTLSLNGPIAALQAQGTLNLDSVFTAPPVAARPNEVLAVHHAEAELAFDAAQHRIDIASLRFSYPYVMVQRSADGVFPYSALSGGGVSDGTATTDGSATTAIRIKSIDVANGRADFLDRTVEPEYWTALADLAASAARVQLPGPEVGDFHIAARQDEINPMDVTGKADAKGWQLQANVEAVFLPTLNAYLAPLLGYKMDTGVLSLEITGRLSANALRTSNLVTLRNVTLTQTGLDIIQRDTGVPLPIALALLKDTSGTIELAVPLEGELQERRFRLGSLIEQALGKAVRGALASPLKLLGLLFGTKGPPRALAVDPIPFAVGSGAIDVAGEIRLEQIARILASHTELTLVAKPEVSAQDAAIVGDSGLQALAAERAAAVERALVDGTVQPQLPAARLVMVPWERPADGTLSERSGIYVEMQLSADYGG